MSRKIKLPYFLFRIAIFLLQTYMKQHPFPSKYAIAVWDNDFTYIDKRYFYNAHSKSEEKN